jgi:uncharacterized protein YegL/pimeloyl-ACP methyl ester carboxylesterase
MRKLLKSIIFINALFTSLIVNANSSVSVVFVLDESGSVSRSNFLLETQGFQSALSNLPLDGSIEVSIIGFSSGNSVIVDRVALTSTNLADVQNALANNPKNSGGTNMSGAINSSTQLLLNSNAPSKVICLATDGEPDSQSSSTLAANNAKSGGIFLSPIGIGLSSSGKTFLDSIASNPPVPNPNNFTDFATVVTNVCVGVTSSALNLDLTPDLVDFGVTQGTGGADQCNLEETVLLTNRSNQPTEITSVSIEGEDAANFQIVSAFGVSGNTITFPVTLASLLSTQIEIKLAPISVPDDDSYDATIKVSGLDGNNVSGDFFTTLSAPVGSACLNVAVNDAQSIVKSIDGLSKAKTAAGQDVVEADVTPLLADTTFGRAGLVADGNARLLITANTSITTGTMRFEIIAPAQTEAVFGSLASTSNDAGNLLIDIPLEQNSNGSGQATAVLRAGERFLGASGEAEINIEIRTCLLDEQNSCSEIQQTRTIKERRAPVVLVHGLWANSDSFEATEDGLFTSGKPGLRQSLSKNGIREVGVVNYDSAIGPSGTMRSNSTLLSSEINSLCDKIINNRNLACTRSDIVGHSMGGLVSRKFIQNNSNFSNARNFEQGSVRRLMTMGTPHFGSGLASLLKSEDVHIQNCIRKDRLVVEDLGLTSPLVDQNGNVIANIIRTLGVNEGMTQAEIDAGYEILANGFTFVNEAVNLLDNIGKPVNVSPFGAINYLALQSNGLASLNIVNQNVTTAGLVGNIGDNLLFSGLLGNTVAKAIGYTGCSSANIFVDEDSDGVVPISSAVGNLADKTREYPNVQHSGMGQNQDAIDWVIEVIDKEKSIFSPVATPVNSVWKFEVNSQETPLTIEVIEERSVLDSIVEWTQKHSRFLKPTLFALLMTNNVAQAQDASSLTLTVSNDTPNPGDQITFTLDDFQGELTGVSLVGENTDLLDENSPFSWTTTIPNSLVGEFTFKVTAFSGAGFLTSNSVSIQIVESTDNIRSIIFEPTERVVIYPGREVQLKLIGQGSDGFIRNLTGSLQGTLYSENMVDGLTVTEGDSPAISVSSEGLITAAQPGEAEVVSSYGPYIAVRRVLVLPVQPDDADGDGVLDSIEQSAGTNPFNVDSDGDNTSDYIELGVDFSQPSDSDGDAVIDALDADTNVVIDELGQRIAITSSAGSIVLPFQLGLDALPTRNGDVLPLEMGFGVIGLTVKDLTAGQELEITLHYPESLSGRLNFLNYGSATSDENAAIWYTFTDFSSTNNKIVLRMSDDGLGDTSAKAGEISILGGLAITPNEAPEVSDVSVSATEGGSVISGTVAVVDPDGDELVYALVDPSVAGLTFNSDGTYNFDPSAVEYDNLNDSDVQTLSLVYAVSGDPAGSINATLTITVQGITDIATPPPSSGSSGGGCTYIPGSTSGADPILLLSVLFSVFYLIRRRLFGQSISTI